MSNTDSKRNELRQALCKLVTDPKAIELELQLQAFNPFSVLQVGRYEIRHTNTLGWLLDPRGNHGLSDAFLRLFLARALDDKLVEILPGLLGNTEELRVVREHSLDKKRLDILLVHPDFEVAIEAKVDAKQSAGQLRGYGRTLSSKRKNGSLKTLFCLFLTLDETEPISPEVDQPNWINILWRDCVLDPLSKIVTSDFLRSTMAEPQRYFIASYVESLRELYVEPGDKVSRLTEELREAHPKAVDKLKPNPENTDIWGRHEVLLEHFRKLADGDEEKRAEIIRTSLVEQGFTPYDTRRTYIAFLPFGWTRENYPNLYSSDKKISMPRVVFEVVNRGKEPFIKLMFCFMHPSFKDQDENWQLRHDLFKALKLQYERRELQGAWTFKELADKYSTVYSIRSVLSGDKKLDKAKLNTMIEEVSVPLKALLDKQAVSRQQTPKIAS